jgi:hypothetical protein
LAGLALRPEALAAEKARAEEERDVFERGTALLIKDRNEWCGKVAEVEDDLDEARASLASAVALLRRDIREVLYAFAWEEPRAGRTQLARDALDKLDALISTAGKRKP